MTQIFLTVSGIVIVVNIIYILIPNGKFEKYAQLTMGLIVILTVSGLLFNIELSSDILNFDESRPIYNSQQLKDTVDKQTGDIIAYKIKNKLDEKFSGQYSDVTVDFADDIVKSITITVSVRSSSTDIIKTVADFMKIDAELINIE